LLDSLTDDYDPHPALFDHFLQFLEDIENGKAGSERRDLLIRLILFQLVLLHEVGLRPILNVCANCQRPFAADWREVLALGRRAGLQDCEMNFPDKVGSASRPRDERCERLAVPRNGRSTKSSAS
jgi:recombinational DNA repair protein (RecF pathway)